MPVPRTLARAVTERFVAARRLRIPPYNWIPPEDLPLQETLNQQQFSEDNLPECPVITEEDFEQRAGRDVPNPDERGVFNLAKVPNPDSDFTHFDKGDPGFGRVTRSRALQIKNEAAFQRLKLAFDFMVCRTIDLCFAINNAVTEDDLKKYGRARQNYIEFLRNLDNHEPRGALGLADLKRGLGYGKHYRWLFIDPIIKKVRIRNGPVKLLIMGAVIILLWNPHSSSSGIPIKH